MRVRIALLLTVSAGPLVAAAKIALHPDGDDFAAIRGRTSASVCLITVAGVTNEAVGSLEPAPGIDALRSLGITCEDAHAAAELEPAGVVSLYTGLLPSSHGVRSPTDRLDPQRITLALALQTLGMRTAAFSNVALFSPGIGLDRGFEVTEHVANSDANGLTARASRWLREFGEEYAFLWIHYQPLDGATERDAASALETLVTQTTDALRRARKLEGTFLIAAGTSTPRIADAVPLMVRVPGRYVRGSERDGTCSVLDVSLTLLEIFGRVGFFGGAGRSLLGESRALYSGQGFARPAPFERVRSETEVRVGVLLDRHALEDTASGAPRLFDVASDPSMQRPLPIPREPRAIADELRDALRAVEATR